MNATPSSRRKPEVHLTSDMITKPKSIYSNKISWVIAILIGSVCTYFVGPFIGTIIAIFGILIVGFALSMFSPKLSPLPHIYYSCPHCDQTQIIEFAKKSADQAEHYENNQRRKVNCTTCTKPIQITYTAQAK